MVSKLLADRNKKVSDAFIEAWEETMDWKMQALFIKEGLHFTIFRSTAIICYNPSSKMKEVIGYDRYRNE